MTSQWQFVRATDGRVDDDLLSIRMTDSFNRFARSAEVTLEDPDSTKKDEYPRGTLVELEVSIPELYPFARRFAGFVQDHERDKDEITFLVLVTTFGFGKESSIEVMRIPVFWTSSKTLSRRSHPWRGTATQVDVKRTLN